MKILHFVSDVLPHSYPLGAPGRFTDILYALNSAGHENSVILPDLPVLQAALERKDIPFTSTNIRFLDQVFRIGFCKKLLNEANPDAILYYGDIENNDFAKILARHTSVPMIEIDTVYEPILRPDASTKKIDREETLTDITDIIIGCFCPFQDSLKSFEMLFEIGAKMGHFTFWISIAPNLSTQIQQMAKNKNIEHKCRFFDVTVPRGAFYKGCDIIFIPDGQIDSDMSQIEALSLGRTFVSCSTNYAEFFSKLDQKTLIISGQNSEKLDKSLGKLAKDIALRIKFGEKGRKIYEKKIKPDNLIKKFIGNIEFILENQDINPKKTKT